MGNESGCDKEKLENHLQRYTRSPEIKGRNARLQVKLGDLATLPKGASRHCT